MSGPVTKTCNPKTWDAEAGVSSVRGQPRSHSETLFQNNNNNNNNKVGFRSVHTFPWDQTVKLFFPFYLGIANTIKFIPFNCI